MELITNIIKVSIGILFFAYVLALIWAMDKLKKINYEK